MWSKNLSLRAADDNPANPRMPDAGDRSRDALGELLEGCRQYLLLVANQELDAEVKAKIGASDLVQETFLEAQQDFHRFDGSTEADLLAWLRQILLNNVRDATRRYRETGKREVSREVASINDRGSNGANRQAVSAQTESPSWFARRNENHQAVEQALARLPVHYQQVIELRNLQLRSFVEIGQIMNRSPEAVRKLWTRALKALEREWE